MIEERRQSDLILNERLEKIQKTVESTHDILLGEHGICVRMSVCEKQIEATHNELSEHKKNGFRVTDVILGIGVLVTAIFELFKK